MRTVSQAFIVVIAVLLVGSSAAAKDVSTGATGNVSTTTGWRSISGWQDKMVRTQPNLAHWTWLPMREMSKAYIHLAPGQVAPKDGVIRPPKYVKPKHIATVVVPRKPVAVVEMPSRAPRYVKPNHVAFGDSTGAENYVRPNHVPTVVPPPTTNTYIKLSVPKTNVALSAGKTSSQLAVPKTSVKLSAPSTSIKLAAPDTKIQLASKSTSATLKHPVDKLKAPADEFAAQTANGDADSFSSPDPYAHNVYGLSRRVDGGSERAVSQVRAHLLTKRKKTN